MLCRRPILDPEMGCWIFWPDVRGITRAITVSKCKSQTSDGPAIRSVTRWITCLILCDGLPVVFSFWFVHDFANIGTIQDGAEGLKIASEGFNSIRANLSKNLLLPNPGNKFSRLEDAIVITLITRSHLRCWWWYCRGGFPLVKCHQIH